MLPNHYEALGARPEADRAALRAAYLATMRAIHPDRRPGDQVAEARARAANAAWHALREAGRREAYDRALRAARSPMAPQVTVAAADHAARPHLAARVGRAFHRATLKAGGAIVLAGLVLLLLTAAR